MSTYVSVEISPETTIRPVLTSVSHATRPYGSSARTASSTPSEIWSAILSGCPSVTDSEVNRNSLSEYSVMFARVGSTVGVGTGSGKSRASLGERARSARSRARTGVTRAAPSLSALDEVDDQRHAVHSVARAQPVLQEVRVLARHTGARVDLDRKARRTLRDLRHVDQLQAMTARAAARPDRRLARLDDLGEEPIELGRRDSRRHPVAQRDR